MSRRLVDPPRDQTTGAFFCQKLRIAIQLGNITSVLGKFPDDSDTPVVHYYFCIFLK